jgi:Glu-tRNA(Gln) amidotransferase subunit E-like FAD-binding protein
MERENQILESYRDFRGALKESQVMAFQVLKKAETQVEVAKTRLEDATKALESNTSEDRAAIAKLELTRDERLRDLQAEDKRYQIAKDLAENLSVSYNTTEVVMARLVQTTDVKERVYSQSVSFFGTNETVFTALNASFTSLQGLHETTQTLEAMKEGMNKSLETLADVGDKVQEDALRAGYGPTIKAESVKKLLDSVINFQEKSRSLIAEMRDLSTRNEQEISQAVEDGKRRMVQLTKAGKLLTHE